MQRKAKDSETLKDSEKPKSSAKAAAAEKPKSSAKAAAAEKPKSSVSAPGAEKTADSEKSGDLITVRGVVAPSEWDMRDEVTAVTIYAQDEAEYLVNARSMVKRLTKLMDEEIEAHGMLGVDEYGNEVFVVADFAPIDVETDEDGGGEWDDEEDVIAEDDAELDEEVAGEDGEEWSEDGGRRRRAAPGGWKRREKKI